MTFRRANFKSYLEDKKIKNKYKLLFCYINTKTCLYLLKKMLTETEYQVEKPYAKINCSTLVMFYYKHFLGSMEYIGI